MGELVVKSRDAIVCCCAIRNDDGNLADCLKADLRRSLDDDIWKKGKRKQWSKGGGKELRVIKLFFLCSTWEERSRKSTQAVVSLKEKLRPTPSSRVEPIGWNA